MQIRQARIFPVWAWVVVGGLLLLLASSTFEKMMPHDVDVFFVDGPRGILAYKLVNNSHEPKTLLLRERFVVDSQRTYEADEFTDVKTLAPGESRPAWVYDRMDLKDDFPIVYERKGDDWVKADYKYR